jgi:DNA-binding transcriptional MerR regulator
MSHTSDDRQLPVGPLFCIIDGPARPGPRPAVVSAAVRGEFRRLAARAGVRRRFAPHQLRHAHALKLAREGVPLNIIQHQLGHANLDTTSIYLQGIDPEEIIAAVRTRRAPMVSASAPGPGPERFRQRERHPARLARASDDRRLVARRAAHPRGAGAIRARPRRPARGSIVVRHAKGGRRRGSAWTSGGWEHLRPWLTRGPSRCLVEDHRDARSQTKAIVSSRPRARELCRPKS